MSAGRLVAGVDGGGTRTTLCCLDERGKVISTAEYGPLNLNGTDREILDSTLRDVVAHLLQMEAQGFVLAGLTVATAGSSHPQCRPVLEAGLRGAGYHGPFDVRGDHEAALRGAVGATGAVLIAGTGSICYGRNSRGQTARAGGWGYLLDDEGSGYALGREILRAVLRAGDGRADPTLLTAMVEAHFGVEGSAGMMGRAYDSRQGKANIASLAPLLQPAWDRGDPAAQQIGFRAVEELALLCSVVLNRLSLQAGPLALAGGVLTHTPALQQELTISLQQSFPKLQVVAPKRDAAWGTADLAKERYLG